jgi:hypothetical protein
VNIVKFLDFTMGKWNDKHIQVLRRYKIDDISNIVTSRLRADITNELLISLDYLRENVLKESMMYLRKLCMVLLGKS